MIYFHLLLALLIFVQYKYLEFIFEQFVQNRTNSRIHTYIYIYRYVCKERIRVMIALDKYYKIVCVHYMDYIYSGSQ